VGGRRAPPRPLRPGPARRVRLPIHDGPLTRCLRTLRLWVLMTLCRRGPLCHRAPHTLTPTPLTRTPLTRTPLTRAPLTRTPLTPTPPTPTPPTLTPPTPTPLTRTPPTRTPARVPRCWLQRLHTRYRRSLRPADARSGSCRPCAADARQGGPKQPLGPRPSHPQSSGRRGRPESRGRRPAESGPGPGAVRRDSESGPVPVAADQGSDAGLGRGEPGGGGGAPLRLIRAVEGCRWG
jgi:hypothetical protein